ncbi:ESPR-type extended signal peptide-containing protein, partial [uncultured Moraxella sp.]|uniref:ESPR-type extended signal peptide-containing protein n=1 Tax=uncultured Moraxella sp. TaxID=263769 RepID=UPI0025CBD703
MNKVYKVIWNHATQTWVAVSEIAQARGKTSSKTDKRAKLSKAAAVVSLAVAGSAVIGGQALAAEVAYTPVYGTIDNKWSIKGTAIGSGSKSIGESTVAYGTNAQTLKLSAVGTSPVAAELVPGGATSIQSEDSIEKSSSVLGAEARTYGQQATAVGNSAEAVIFSTAVGQNAKAMQHASVATGQDAKATGKWSTATGVQAKALAEYSNAIGGKAEARSWGSTAVGKETIVTGDEGTAVGYHADVTGRDGTASGAQSLAGEKATATGAQAKAEGNRATASGFKSNASGANSVASGVNSTANASGAIAIGDSSGAVAEDAIAIGHGAASGGVSSTAIGDGTQILPGAVNSTAIGTASSIQGTSTNAYSLGTKNSIGASNVAVVGNNNTITPSASNTMVLGNNVTATKPNSVILGEGSTDRDYTQVTCVTIPNIADGTSIVYDGFNGTATGIVSIGSKGKERQLTNVAPGEISATSTDTINGSQLYAVAYKLGEQVQNIYFHTNINETNQGAGDPATNKGRIMDKAGATGAFSITAGVEAKAISQYGIAIGKNSNSTGSAVVIGANAAATGLADDANTPNREDAQQGANGAVAIGENARASAASGSQPASIAIGQNATAAGVRVSNTTMRNGEEVDLGTAIAIGAKATAKDASVAIGQAADAGLSQFATAVGVNSRALGDRSSAYGVSSIANGQKSVALGFEAKASKDNDLAVGGDAKASGGNSAAIGPNASASGDTSLAVGYTANATGKNAVALGRESGATGIQAAALTTFAKAHGKDSIAAGVSATTSADALRGVAIARQSSVTAEDGIAVGYTAKVSGTESIAIGKSSNVTGNQSIAVGVGHTVEADNAGAFGDPSHLTAEAIGSYAVGNNNTITSANTFVLGSGIGRSSTDLAAESGEGTVANSVYLGNESEVTRGVGLVDGNGVGSLKTWNKDQRSGTTATTAGASGTVSTAKVGGITYGSTEVGGQAFAGATSTGAVSVGSSGEERRIQNVAAGEISKTSTDAINGSQLYAVAHQASKPITFKANSNRDTLNTTMNFPSDNGLERILGDEIVIKGANGNIQNLSRNSDAATAGAYSARNVQTVVDNQGVQIQIATNPIFDSVQFVSSSGPKITNDGGTNIKVAKADGSATRITNVANGTEPNDAVNLSQLNATRVSVVAGNNTYVTEKPSADGKTYKIDAEKTVVTTGTGLTVSTSGGDSANNVTTYNVELDQATKDQLAKEETVIAGDSGLVTVDNTAQNTSGGKEFKVDIAKGTFNGVTTAGKLNADGTTAGVATVGDVITAVNSGFFTVNANGSKAADIKFGDTLNFANGTGTTAVVKDGGVAYNTNVDGTTIVVDGATNSLKVNTDALPKTVVAQGNNTVVSSNTIGTTTTYTVDAEKTTVSKAATSPITVTEGAKSATGVTNYEVGLSIDDTTLEVVDGKLKAKAVEKVVLDDTVADNIATVNTQSGKVAGEAGETYKVGVSKAAVKTAAKEAINVTGTAPIAVTKTDENGVDTYNVTFDGTKAAESIPLTYKANGGNAQTVNLNKGLNFTNGDKTVATVGTDGKVVFDLSDDAKAELAKVETVVAGDSGLVTVDNTAQNTSGGKEFKVDIAKGTFNNPSTTGELAAGNTGVATVADVVEAVNKGFLTTKVGGNQVEQVGFGDDINFVNGTGTTARIVDGANGDKGITFDVKTDGTTIKIDDNGNLTVNTDNLPKTKLVDGKNTTVQGDGTEANPYKVDATKTTVTAATGGKVEITGGTEDQNGVINYTVGLDAATKNIIDNAVVDVVDTDTVDLTKTADNKIQADVKTTTLTAVAAGLDKAGQVNAPSADDAKKLVNAQDLATVINNSGWNVKGDVVDGGVAKGTHATTLINPGETVTLRAGKNLALDQATDVFTYSLQDDISLNSVTTVDLTATGATTVNDFTVAPNSAVDMGNNTLTNVGSGGDTDSNGANIGDIKRIAAQSVEKVVLDDTVADNIATVNTQSGKVAGEAGETYKVGVSKAAVKTAAQEAIDVVGDGKAITVTNATANGVETFTVNYNGAEAAKTTPLTYKANGANAQTVNLSEGLNFTNGDKTVATVGADGKVVFDLSDDAKAELAKVETVVAGDSGLVTVDNTAQNTSGGKEFKVDITKGTFNAQTNNGALGDVTNTNGVATVADVVSAVNTGYWTANVDGSTKVADVNFGDSLNFVDGTATDAVLKDGGVSFNVKTDGTTIKVVDGNLTVNTDGLASTEVVSGKNTTVTPTKDGNKTTYKVDATKTTVTAATDGKVEITGGTEDANGVINYTVGLDDATKTVINNAVTEVQDSDSIDFTKTGNTITATVNTGTSTVVAGQAVTTEGNKVATVGDIVKTINNVSWKVASIADGGENSYTTADSSNITAGDTLNIDAGKNIKISGSGNKLNIATKDDVTFNNITTSNLTATGDTVVKNFTIKPNSAVDMGGNTLTNVGSGGDTDSNGANIGDIKRIAAKSVEKVVLDDAVADNIATVSTESGAAAGNAGETYKVGVSKAAVKTAAKEAINVTGTAPIAVTKTDENGVDTYNVTFDGTKAAESIPLTYKANGGNAQTVNLNKGLDFTNGDKTVATVGADGKVVFDLSDAAKEQLAKEESVSTGTPDLLTVTKDKLNDTKGQNYNVDVKKGTFNAQTNNGALGDVTNTNGVATVADVVSAVNTGYWTANVDGSTKVADVNFGDSLNFVDGTATDAVLKDGGVSFNVKTDGTTIKVVDGNLTVNTDGLPKTVVAEGSNVKVKADTQGTTTTYTVHADKSVVAPATGTTSVTVTPSEQVDQTTGSKTTTYNVDLSAETKAQIAKVETVVAGDSGLVTVDNTAQNKSGGTEFKVDIAKGTFNNPSATGELAAGNTGVATVADVVEAVNKGFLTTKVNGTQVEQVGFGDDINFVDGKGTTARISGQDITYDVNLISSDNSISITDGAKGAKDLTVNTGTSTVGGDGKAITTDTDEVANLGDVVNTINNVSWSVNSVAAGGENTYKATDASKISAGDKLNINAGKNIAISGEGDTLNIATAENVTFNNITANNLTVGPVTINKDGINAGNTKITNVANGTNANDAVNLSQLNASTAANAWKITGNNDNTNATTVGNQTVSFNNGTGTTAVVDGTNVTYNINTDGTTVKVGTDGNLTVVTGGLTTTDGAVSLPTGDAGTSLVNQTTVMNAVNQSGWKLAADGTAGTELINPSETVTFIAGTNLEVTRDGANITYKTADNVSFNNITASNLTVGPVTITNDGIDAGNTTITNVAPGTNGTDAVNLSQLNASTAANAWKITGNNNAATATTVGNQTVSFNNGAGTTAVVNGTNVTYNINTDGTTVKVGDNGNLTVVTGNTTVTDGKAGVATDSKVSDVATIGDIVNTINNVSWNVFQDSTAQTDPTKRDAVTAGDNIVFKAGTNTTVNVSSNGKTTDITYDVDFSKIPTTELVVDAGKVQLPNTVEGAKFVNATNITNAINNSGWKTVLTNGNTEIINPGDTVNYVNGTGTAANVTKVGDVVNVAYDVKVDGTTIKVGQDGNLTVDVNSLPSTKLANSTTTVVTGAGTTADPYKVNVVTGGTTVNSNGTVAIAGGANTTDVATIGDITSTINKGFWTTKVNGTNVDQVNFGDAVNFVNGTGTVARANGTNITFDVNLKSDDGSVVITNNTDGSLNLAVNVSSLPTTKLVNGNNTVVTGTGTTADPYKVNVEGDLTNITSIANGDTKITLGDNVVNVGGAQITGVANGTKPTDAVNLQQLNAAKTEVKAGNNVNVTSATGSAGQTIYTVNAEKSTVTAADGSPITVASTTNATTGVTDYKVGVAVDGDTITIKDGKLVSVAGEANKVRETVVAGSTNVVVKDDKTNATGGKEFTVDLAKDITVDSVTANTVNVGPVTMTGNTAEDGVSELSVGSPTAPSRITNVAPGVKGTDAVNVNQLQGAVTNINNRINGLEDDME